MYDIIESVDARSVGEQEIQQERGCPYMEASWIKILGGGLQGLVKSQFGD